MALAEVASLWIGPELSWLEQLCLRSFVEAGHRTTLFTYDKVEGVPEGVHVEPASSFLPATEIIRHARTGSPAYHADLFRLRMLRDSRLIWVDTDAYCLRPFKVPRHGHFHGWLSDDKPIVNNGVLKLPKKSKTLARMLEFTSDEYPIPPWYSEEKQAELRERKARGEGVHVSLLPWGVWGPDALTHFLKETGEIRFSFPGHVLYPVRFSHKRSLIKPSRRHVAEQSIRDETLSIHFWGRRIRAAASETGGVPPRGSFLRDLLDKHGIDPKPTAHLMKPTAPREVPARIDPAEVDFSVFDTDDIVNLAMQRSSAVRDPEAVRAWLRGDDGPLRAEAEANRDGILHAAFTEISEAFARVFPRLEALKPGRIADIGAGYAFLDLLAFRHWGCDLVLIDIEETEARHFGFAADGAGYSSLAKARAFLVANGVPERRIRTINPRHEDLAEAGIVDAAISLISCGFHYPAQTYDAFFRDQVRPGGAVILDIRKGSGGIPYLKGIGKTHVLAKERKHSCVFVEKEVA